MSKSKHPARMTREVGLFITRVAAGTLATVVVLAVATAFVGRIGFALELEWMEGGMLHQALRFQQGLPLYPAPSADFVPFLYTPLYAIVVGLFGWIAPLDYFLGRMVSVAAVVLSCGALWVALVQEGRPRLHGWLGIGLFAAGYVFTYRWLDLARADSLFLALLAWSLVFFRRALMRRAPVIWASVLMALAFWTKQTAAPFIVASGVFAFWLPRRQGVIHVSTLAIIDGAGVLVGNAVSEGWLWSYIYELHQSHAFNVERFTRKSWGMLFHAAPFVVVGIAAWAIANVVQALRMIRIRSSKPPTQWVGDTDSIAYWGAIAAAAVVVSALGYSTQFAEVNAFIPAVYFGALFVGLVLPRQGTAAAVGYGLVSAQLLFSLAFEPQYFVVQRKGWGAWAESYRRQEVRRTIPSAEQRSRASALRAELESAPGPVFATHRPWWNVIAGGPGHVGRMGLHDLSPAQRRRIVAELRRRLSQGAYSVVWVEGDLPPWIRDALQPPLWSLEVVLEKDQRILPMTGFMSEAGMIEPHRASQRKYQRSADGRW